MPVVHIILSAKGRRDRQIELARERLDSFPRIGGPARTTDHDERLLSCCDLPGDLCHSHGRRFGALCLDARHIARVGGFRQNVFR